MFAQRICIYDICAGRDLKASKTALAKHLSSVPYAWHGLERHVEGHPIWYAVGGEDDCAEASTGPPVEEGKDELPTVEEPGAFGFEFASEPRQIEDFVEVANFLQNLLVVSKSKGSCGDVSTTDDEFGGTELGGE